MSQWLLEQDGLHDLALRGSRDTGGLLGPATGAEALGGGAGAETRSSAAPDASPLRPGLPASASAAALATAADALQRSLEAAQAQAAAAAAAAAHEAGREDDGGPGSAMARNSSSGSSTQARPPPLQVWALLGGSSEASTRCRTVACCSLVAHWLPAGCRHNDCCQMTPSQTFQLCKGFLKRVTVLPCAGASCSIRG